MRRTMIEALAATLMLPLAIQFLVSDQYFDIGMLATGLMIATLPVLVLYLFLSEWFVKGMTAGPSRAEPSRAR
jgi:ABC-type glycerol-3-phosphate transport system permease component